jgi:bacillithiol system protein YtxJ
MIWNNLVSLDDLTKIKELSYEQPQVIFKHSTRCSISVVAKNRLDKAIQPSGASFYYLDLLNHRDISAKIAEDYNVYHESPQILLIKNGECIYDESHSSIQMDDIVENL